MLITLLFPRMWYWKVFWRQQLNFNITKPIWKHFFFHWKRIFLIAEENVPVNGKKTSFNLTRRHLVLNGVLGKGSKIILTTVNPWWKPFFYFCRRNFCFIISHSFFWVSLSFFCLKFFSEKILSVSSKSKKNFKLANFIFRKS